MPNELYSATDFIDGINFDIVVSENGVREIRINKKSDQSKIIKSVSTENSLIKNVLKQLKEYFKRERREFSLPLEIIGTDFQKKVWIELLKIPFGKVITYNQLAINLGDKKLIRAAAAANGANPLPVLIPCHRVIGSDGSLVGYGGGLQVKQKLLELEGSWSLNLLEQNKFD